MRLNLFYFFSRTARAPDQLRCRWFMFVHKNFGDYRKTFAEFWNRLFLFWWNFHLVFFFSAFPMIDRSPWVYDINWNAQRVRIPILFSSYELFWELLERKLSERWICSAAVNVSRCDEMLSAIELTNLRYKFKFSYLLLRSSRVIVKISSRLKIVLLLVIIWSRNRCWIVNVKFLTRSSDTIINVLCPFSKLTIMKQNRRKEDTSL